MRLVEYVKGQPTGSTVIPETGEFDYSPVPLALSWWTMQDSNLRPPACEAGALPTELIVRA